MPARFSVAARDLLRRHVCCRSTYRVALVVQEGAHLNVVFMDNDIFVFKSIARIFKNEDFDYGCTISDSKAMPARCCACCCLLHLVVG